MKHDRVLSAIRLVAIANLGVLLLSITGPAFTQTLRHEFSFPLNSRDKSKRMSFEISDFHVFHGFMGVDLVFYGQSTGESFNVSLDSIITTNIHRNKNETIIPARVEHICFHEVAGRPESDPIRLYQTTYVDFSDLHSWITLKYKGDGTGKSLNGRFQWFYGDPPRAIVQLFLRFVIFITAISLLIRLLMTGIDFESADIFVKLTAVLDLLIIIGSDPLYVLNYFTRSSIFRAIDACLNNCLLQVCLFTAWIVLVMGDLPYEDMTVEWFMLRFIPFGICGILLSMVMLYYNYLIEKDPLHIPVVMFYCVAISKAIYAVIYWIMYVRAERRVQSTDLPEEKRAMIYIGKALLVSVIIAEISTFFENNLVVQFGYQIIPLVAMAIYAFMFTYFNWPLKDSDALDKPNDVEDLENDLEEEQNEE